MNGPFRRRRGNSNKYFSRESGIARNTYDDVSSELAGGLSFRNPLLTR
jgi:hypothetical protein